MSLTAGCVYSQTCLYWLAPCCSRYGADTICIFASFVATQDNAASCRRSCQASEACNAWIYCWRPDGCDDGRDVRPLIYPFQVPLSKCFMVPAAHDYAVLDATALPLSAEAVSARCPPPHDQNKRGHANLTPVHACNHTIVLGKQGQVVLSLLRTCACPAGLRAVQRSGQHAIGWRRPRTGLLQLLIRLSAGRRSDAASAGGVTPIQQGQCMVPRHGICSA